MHLDVSLELFYLLQVPLVFEFEVFDASARRVGFVIDDFLVTFPAILLLFLAFLKKMHLQVADAKLFLRVAAVGALVLSLRRAV